jgi:hypothetical protein
LRNSRATFVRSTCSRVMCAGISLYCFTFVSKLCTLLNYSNSADSCCVDTLKSSLPFASFIVLICANIELRMYLHIPFIGAICKLSWIVFAITRCCTLSALNCTSNAP